MTREEQIERACDIPYHWNPEFQLRDDFNNQCKYYSNGFEAGAKWADSHPVSPWKKLKSISQIQECMYYFFKKEGHLPYIGSYTITSDSNRIVWKTPIGEEVSTPD